MSSPYGERIVRLEEQVRHANNEIQKLNVKMEKIDEKLTELLQLKHKGAGALWLISAVAAIACAELIRFVFNYFFGK